MNIPLVSPYKVPFILHRISSTFFGGFELLNEGSSTSPSPLSQPLSSCLQACCSASLLSRLTIYLAPTAAGIITSIAIDVHLITDNYTALLSLAALDGAAVLGLHLLSDKCASKSPKIQTTSPDGKESTGSRNSLQQLLQLGTTEEGEGGERVQETEHFRLSISYYLKHSLSLIAFSLVAGSLIALMSSTFRPSKLAQHHAFGLGSNPLLASVTFITAWFTFTVAHHSLTLGPPPEPAAYSPNDLVVFRLRPADRLNRPLHLLLPLAFLTATSASGGVFEETNQQVQLLSATTICLLPLLWLLGVVPPLAAAFHCLLETTNSLLMGGSPAGVQVVTSGGGGLLATVLLTGSAFLLAHFFSPDSGAFLLVCSIIGFITSNKWLGNVKGLLGSFKRSLRFLFSMFAIVILNLVAFYPENQKSNSSQKLRLSGSPETIEQTLSGALFLLLIFISIGKHIQRVYLFNWIKNPLDVFLPERLLKKVQSNRVLIILVRVCLHCVLPLTSLLLLLRCRLDVQEISDHLHQSNLSYLLLNLLVFRLLRHLWTSPVAFAGQLVAMPLLVEGWIAEHYHSLLSWPAEVRHFVLTLVLSTTTDFFHKLYLVVVLLWGSVFLKKQRLGFSWMLFVFNIIIFPANLAIIAVSALLRTPILPLFTLPVYLLSFPRPLQFWSTTPTTITPNSGSSSSDAAYYQQLLPRLLEALRRQRLFWDFCRAGEFLLARYEDRLLWIQVLESGHGYVVVQAKGLELQETSCHSIEATAIDHILERAFGGGGDTRRSSSACLNSHFLYTVSPVTRVTVKTYSDAKNVLTGIIDSPETFVRLKATFCQALVWLLLRDRVESVRKEAEGQNESKTTENVLKKKKKKKVAGNAVADVEAAFASTDANQVNRPLTYELLQPSLQWSNWSYQYSRMRGVGGGGSLQTPSGPRGNPNPPTSNPVNGCTLEWFQEALRAHETESSSSSTLNVNELTSLNLSYCSIATVCHRIIFSDSHLHSSVPSASNLTLPANPSSSNAQTICQLFNGELPVMMGVKDSATSVDQTQVESFSSHSSSTSELGRRFFEANGDLLTACIRAAQYSIKVAFDSVIFGSSEAFSSVAELASTLKDFDDNWHFGSSSSHGADLWQAAVIAEKGHLFSVGKDLVKENYTSRLLTLRNMDVALCSLNRATIEAIWSSLSLELFYLTNDDEERYSIQAHQMILRNLTVQAADPPLGYPLFASEPMIINHMS